MPKKKNNQSFSKRTFSNRYFQIGLSFTILIFIRFLPIFLESKTIFFGDDYMLMVPGKLFSAFWLKQGILAMWNPTIFAGLPLVGDINQSILYPTTLLFTFLHPANAVNITLIAHLGITFLGTYLLSYKLTKNHWGSAVAAVLWSFSTQLTGSLHNLSSIQSIIWLPLIIWAGLNVFASENSSKNIINNNFKNKLIFSLIVMIQFLGGYPQHIVFSIMLAVAFSFFMSFINNNEKITIAKLKPWLLSWIITGLLTIGITTFIWLPFVETLQDSTRTAQSQAQSTSGSLHPIDMIKTVLPYAFDKPADGMKWGPKWNAMPNLVFYITWIGLLLPFLVFIKKKAKKVDYFYLIVTVTTIAFAMGEYLPGYEILQNIIPLFKFSRGPSTILMLTNLVLAVWVGSIVARYSQESKKEKSKNSLQNSLISKQDFKIILSLAIAIIIGAVGLFALVNYQFSQFWILLNQFTRNAFSNSAFHTIPKDIVIFRIITQNILINSLFFIIAITLFYKKRFTIFFIIIALDMIYNTNGNLFFAPNDVYVTLDDPRQEQLLEEFPELSYLESRSLIRNFNSPYTDFGAYFEALSVRAPFSDSYIDQAELENYDHLKRYAVGFTPDWNMPQNINIINGYTTMIPLDVDNTWNVESERETNYSTSINNLPEIKTTNANLQNWAVKYYFVDTWFDTSAEDMSHMKKIHQYKTWQLYEVPGVLSRYRYEDGRAMEIYDAGRKNNDVGEETSHEPNIYSYKQIIETPNKVSLRFDNKDNHTHLIIADRYDENWQASVNGKDVEVKNYEGMRKVAVQDGENEVILNYVPRKFYIGLFISGVVFVVGIGVVWVGRKRGIEV